MNLDRTTLLQACVITKEWKRKTCVTSTNEFAYVCLRVKMEVRERERERDRMVYSKRLVIIKDKKKT